MKLAAQLIFIIALGIWTWLLVKPNPVPTIIAESLIEDVKFVLGKTLHLSAYAVLAWLGTYAFPRRYWITLWIALAIHGVLSELGQHYGSLWYDTHRSGRVTDVIIDCCGVLIGRWWVLRVQSKS